MTQILSTFACVVAMSIIAGYITLVVANMYRPYSEDFLYTCGYSFLAFGAVVTLFKYQL